MSYDKSGTLEDRGHVGQVVYFILQVNMEWRNIKSNSSKTLVQGGGLYGRVEGKYLFCNECRFRI
jgi:hypothetical protein